MVIQLNREVRKVRNVLFKEQNRKWTIKVKQDSEDYCKDILASKQIRMFNLNKLNPYF